MNTKNRRGIAASVILIVVLGVLAVGIWLMWSGPADNKRSAEIDTFEVRSGSFEIIVPTSGELAALRQIEIKNMLESRATIIEIVAEGTQVMKDDVIIRFNDEDLRTRIDDSEDSLDNALNQLENAKANLEIRKKTRESEFAKADLEITLTDLAFKGWEAGEDVKRRQDLQLEQKTAQLDYERQEVRFEASKRLYEQEFISLDEYKIDEIRLVEAETRLKQAQLDIETYEKYDYLQERERKVSDRQQAIDERGRIQTRFDAEVRSAESDLRSAENQVESRTERLEKWRRQIKLCVITAPSDGLVVYATSLNSGGMHRGSNEEPPMVGTDVSPKKTIMVLPDISQMIAEVKVNEALSGQIKNGQKSTIVSDAHPDLTLTGEVISVGVLAETGGWRDPNRRDYTVKILLDDFDHSLGLKPSMRCRADINVDSVNDALYVPIQAVFREGSAAYVWIPDERGYSQKEISIGQASEMYVEILDGLANGDFVLTRVPEPKEIVSTLELTESVIPSANAGVAAPAPESTNDTPSHGAGMGDGSSREGRGGREGGSGQGRPSREQIQEMMKNLTPEEREAWQKRIEERRNRDGGEDSNHSEGESDQEESNQGK